MCTKQEVTLTMNNYDRFFAMVSCVPQIAKLWNPLTKQLNAEDFENALGVLSSGEVHMAKFFASVWFHHNHKYGFDLVDAVARVDIQHRQLIIDWVENPFYP